MDYSTVQLIETLFVNLKAEYTGVLPPRETLGKMLQEALSTAAKRWPGVHLNPAFFVAYLAERLSGERSLLEDLERTYIDDVYLCAACQKEDPAAQRILMELTQKLIKSSLSNFSASGILVDEVQQQLLERLTTPGVENRPRLALYNGSSRLVSWLRVVIVRTILDMRRKHQNANRYDDGLLMARISDDDQELAYFKSLYATEFKRAFHQALSVLSENEKNLLCYQLLDGMTLEEIAEILNVNRSTICRRLKQVRDKLQVYTRREMMEHLEIDGDEFESILGLIASRLDASVCRILEEDSSGD